jgi:hypothetical protein
LRYLVELFEARKLEAGCLYGFKRLPYTDFKRIRRRHGLFIPPV